MRSGPAGIVDPVTSTATSPQTSPLGSSAPCVSTSLFEGPIDLLVHLVSTHELDVCDLEIAPIVVSFVEVMEAQPIGARSEFLVMAALLLEMKSVRLLPVSDPVEDEEELYAWEERDLLLSRLLECRAYAAISDVLAARIEAAEQSVPREVGLDDGFTVEAPDLLAGVTPLDLHAAYLRASAEVVVPTLDLSHVTVDAVTVAETVRSLSERLASGGPISFRDLTKGLAERLEVIVHFLAVLELCKLGKLAVSQAERFGDLVLEWRGGAELFDVAIEEYEG